MARSSFVDTAEEDMAAAWTDSPDNRPIAAEAADNKAADSAADAAQDIAADTAADDGGGCIGHPVVPAQGTWASPAGSRSSLSVEAREEGPRPPQ